ncbi:MAG: efflux RND transporter periplasmic adaptor subunit [Betaproteobacteria bacterium]|nr:efflux RND transporter periplasmic adaptor subunit [Betaproteobacteria bacterium]
MKQRSGKQMFITVLALALLFGGIYGFQQFRNSMIAKMIHGKGMPPQTVSTTVAGYDTWNPSIDAIGSLRAVKGASLSTETGGLVTAIHFSSGENVPAGKLLVELNAAPLIAQLQQLKASARLAKINYDRDVAQLHIQAVSQSTVDADAATLQGANAQVAAQQAQIAQKMIRAPFAGKLGIRQVDPGQYLAPGAAIVTLQKLDPIYLDFSIPQVDLALVRTGLQIDARSDALPGKILHGRITAVEPQVDANTRNIKIRAALPNPDGKLLPGLFMTVRIDQNRQQRLITLPNAAIAYNPYGSTVFVVQEHGKNAKGQPQLTVEQRFVTTGLTRGDQVAIMTGIRPGEVIVTSGQLKLHNGAPVLVDNSIQPTNDAHPQVGDE